MRSVWTAIALTLVLALPGFARADDETDRLQIALKIESTIAEAIATLPDAQLEALNDTTGPSYLQNVTIDAVDESLKQKIVEANRRSRIAKLSGMVQWGALWSKVKNIGPSMRTLARNQGKMVAIWASIGIAIKIIHPLTCLAMGRPELWAATMPIVPGPGRFIPAAIAVQKLMDRKKLLARYGGASQLREVREALASARASLNLMKPGDLLIPLSPDKNESLSLVAKSGGLLSKFRNGSNGVSAGEFLDFARDLGPPSGFIEGLRSFSLPDEVKLLFALRFLEEEHDGAELLIKLRERFPQSVVAASVPEVPASFIDQVIALQRSTSLDELDSRLGALGQDESPAGQLALARIWTRIVMPGLAEHLDRKVSVNQYRKLLDASLKLQAEIETGAAQPSTVRETLRSLVRQVAGTPDCERPLIADAG